MHALTGHALQKKPDNKLNSIDWVAVLQALRFLDCSSNRLEILPTFVRALARPPGLEEVIAEGNPVSYPFFFMFFSTRAEICCYSRGEPGSLLLFFPSMFVRTRVGWKLLLLGFADAARTSRPEAWYSLNAVRSGSLKNGRMLG